MERFGGTCSVTSAWWVSRIVLRTRRSVSLQEPARADIPVRLLHRFFSLRTHGSLVFSSQRLSSSQSLFMSGSSPSDAVLGFIW